MDILLKAYTRLNLGDDLFIKIICERYPNHNFKMMADMKDKQVYEKINNLKVFPRIKGVERLFKFYSKKELTLAKSVDCTVNIGGSIFIEPSNGSIKMRDNYNKLIDASNKFFIIGSNFGPYENESFYLDYKKMFSKVNDVCFRDEFSYGKFDELSNVRYAPDVVFSLDTENIKIDDTNKYFVISVLNLENRKNLQRYTDQYENTIANLSNKLTSKGYKVLLMSFCKAEGDEIAVNRIKSKTNNNKVTRYYYRGDLNESLTIIKNSNGLVATRFHAMILAWVFKLPTIPLIYSDKMTNVISDVGFNGYYSKISNMSNFNYDLAVKELTGNHQTDISKFIDLAQNQFKSLDVLLDSNTKALRQ